MGGIPGEIHTGDYHLVAADLRNTSDLGHALLDKGLISPDIPTLFVTECVLQVNPKPQTLNPKP
jgi:O-methyltransferase involved in polyketide biosynthesis